MLGPDSRDADMCREASSGCLWQQRQQLGVPADKRLSGGQAIGRAVTELRRRGIRDTSARPCASTYKDRMHTEASRTIDTCRMEPCAQNKCTACPRSRPRAELPAPPLQAVAAYFHRRVGSTYKGLWGLASIGWTPRARHLQRRSWYATRHPVRSNGELNPRRGRPRLGHRRPPTKMN